MGYLQEKIGAVKGFVAEVVGETRKTTWPEKQELWESTIVVIVFMLGLALFVGVMDKVLVELVELLISRGRM